MANSSQFRFWTCLALVVLALVLGCVGDTHCFEQDGCDDECIACVAAVPAILISTDAQLALLEPAAAPSLLSGVFADTQVSTPPPRA